MAKQAAIDLSSDGTSGQMEFIYEGVSVFIDPFLAQVRLQEIGDRFFIRGESGAPDTLSPGYEEALCSYVADLLECPGKQLPFTIADRVAKAVMVHCDELKKRTDDWLKSLTATR